MIKEGYCKLNGSPMSSLKFDVFTINLPLLKESILQTMMDLDILQRRRGPLITEERMSEGKIAGTIIYRLSKAHIIGISKMCSNGCKHRCFSHLNTIIAMVVGLDYIHRKLTDLPKIVRQELVYLIRYRHVNQEMLGLALDAVIESIPEKEGIELRKLMKG
jgi:hypothetical protein